MLWKILFGLLALVGLAFLIGWFLRERNAANF